MSSLAVDITEIPASFVPVVGSEISEPMLVPGPDDDKADGNARVHAPAQKKRKLTEQDIGEEFSQNDIEIERNYENIESKGGKNVKKLKSCSVKTILGHEISTVTFKVLRKVLVKLGVRGYKNKSKEEIVELIANHTHNANVYEGLYNDKEGKKDIKQSTRKKSGCSFRLMNVVFSPIFSHRLGKLSAKRSRQELDGRQSVDSKFWSDVQEAFIDETDENIGKLQFQHVVFNNHNIDPFEIVPHSATKLSAMYGDLKSRHKKAMANFTKSGTHNSEFWEFCNGQIDILYFHFFMRANPEIEQAVTAMMPSDARLDSDLIEGAGEDADSMPKTPSSSNGRSSRNEKTRRFLNIMDNESMRTEVAKERIEEFRSARDYRFKKTRREEEKFEREKRVFYLRQHSELINEIRRLLKDVQSEPDPLLRELLNEDLEMKKQEVARVKEQLQSEQQ